jgi:hypothetical protein
MPQSGSNRKERESESITRIKPLSSKYVEENKVS